jgi:hypothetical protein
MAIVITKPGKIENLQWVGTCTKCGCEIVALESDLDITYGDYRNDNIPYATPVKCPEEFCGSSIYMKQRN